MPASGLAGRFAELDGKRQRQMIDLNCGALTELAHAVLPGMIERKSGAILNVASTAAFQPGPGMAVYFATKAFVLSFSEALHEEVKTKGVVVGALCPGPTATEFGEVAGFRAERPVEQVCSRQRFGCPCRPQGIGEGTGDRNSRPDEQIHGPGAPFLPAELGPADRRVDQAMTVLAPRSWRR